MKIGIIGAGNIGSALATVLVALGHEVVIANSRGPETLGEVAQQTGPAAVTNAEAAEGRDLVVVTIPQLKVLALPYAGDDDRANGIVAALIDSLGFDPVLSGGLDESWRQQPGTPVCATDLTADRAREALAAADPQRPADFSVAA